MGVSYLVPSPTACQGPGRLPEWRRISFKHMKPLDEQYFSMLRMPSCHPHTDVSLSCPTLPCPAMMCLCVCAVPTDSNLQRRRSVSYNFPALASQQGQQGSLTFEQSTARHSAGAVDAHPPTPLTRLSLLHALGLSRTDSHLLTAFASGCTNILLLV